MQRRGSIVAVILAFGAGFAIAQWAPWDASPADPTAATDPGAATEEETSSGLVRAIWGPML